MAEEIQVVVATPSMYREADVVVEVEAVEAEAVVVYDNQDQSDCCATYVEHPIQCCSLTCFVCVVLFVFVYEVMVLQKQRG